MGVIFALLSAVFYALVFFFAKLLVTKARKPLVVAALFQLLAGLLAIPLFLLEPARVNQTQDIWTLLVIVIVLYSFFNVFNFISNKLLDFSITGILSQSTLIITFLGSLMVFGEPATLNKIIAVILILLANISILIKKKSGAKINFKGIVIRLAASIILGSALIIDAKNSVNFSLPLYAFITYFFPGILTYIFSRANFSDVREHIARFYKGIFLMSLMGTLGYYFLIKSFQTLEKSIAAPLNNLSPVIMVCLGIVFLKETDRIWVKRFAVIIVFLAAVLLNLA